MSHEALWGPMRHRGATLFKPLNNTDITTHSAIVEGEVAGGVHKYMKHAEPQLPSSELPVNDEDDKVTDDESLTNMKDDVQKRQRRQLRQTAKTPKATQQRQMRQLRATAKEKATAQAKTVTPATANEEKRTTKRSFAKSKPETGTNEDGDTEKEEDATPAKKRRATKKSTNESKTETPAKQSLKSPSEREEDGDTEKKKSKKPAKRTSAKKSTPETCKETYEEVYVIKEVYDAPGELADGHVKADVNDELGDDDKDSNAAAGITLH